MAGKKQQFEINLRMNDNTSMAYLKSPNFLFSTQPTLSYHKDISTSPTSSYRKIPQLSQPSLTVREGFNLYPKPLSLSREGA